VEVLLGARLAGAAQLVGPLLSQPSEVALRCGARLGETQLGCPPPLPLPLVLPPSFSNMFTFAATTGRPTNLRGDEAGGFMMGTAVAGANSDAKVLVVREVFEVTVAMSSDAMGSLLALQLLLREVDGELPASVSGESTFSAFAVLLSPAVVVLAAAA
jgi:hypothetical protein